MTSVEEIVEQLRDLREQVERLAARNAALELENKLLREENALLKRGLFGRRSERTVDGQLALFEGCEEPVARDVEVSAHTAKRPKPGHGRTPFPEHLPREVVELDVPEQERVCPDCGCAMHALGEDTCERGHIVPARFVVRRYVKKKYACPDGHAVKTARTPDGVLDKGKYEASVYAHVVTSKYADHLPLYRLEGIFKRHGLRMARQSMWDMLVTVDELVAQPILSEMRAQLLQEPVLQSDETEVTMRLEEAKGTRTGYAWAWRSIRGPSGSKVLIEFRQGRGQQGPQQFLGTWKGTLITDGYAGYDEVVRRNGIVHAGCLAHARRKVKDALDVGAREAASLLRRLNRLFRIERAVKARVEARQLDPAAAIELRREIRARRSCGEWQRLQTDVADLESRRSTLPKSQLGKALGYLRRQAGPLSVFLTDPRIPPHNNDTERDLRHIAIGRKNWLVFGSPRGGAVACRLYSLVLSCNAAGVDPETYIEDVLMRVATVPASRIADLTPWGWKAALGAVSPTV